ncbi:MAG: sugar ABC transporter substrate-binding protein, partial [Rhodospirillales bacterium]|nr:sugar ABC transporter substrate-binding protein [Rhodospirillales bacterium]
EIAVREAKQYAGTEINVIWEAGLQSLGPQNFSGPKWEELTGIKVNVIESQVNEMFPKMLQEHRAGTGAYDVLSVVPAWMGDMVRAGAVEPLDAYVDKYGYRAELDDIGDVYRENQMRIGDTIYGFPDDGDVLILYYRKDIFEEMGLSVPTTWDEFYEVSKAITDAKAPEVYGAGFMRVRGLLHYFYQERARNEGCKFFDAESMKATVNGPGCVKALAGMVKDNTTMPPGVEQWGAIESLAAFNAGQIAMTQWWPPVGRWSAGYGTDDIAMQWVPPSVVAGKVGYALPPGGHPQLAAGFAMAVSSSSKNKDAAYLYIQWINSIDISGQRVQLPYTLRDPFRKSHFSSPEYQSLWPDAKEYLDALQAGAVSGLLDLSIINTFAYEDSLAIGLQAVMGGADPQEELDGVAAAWDELTEKVGVDNQREAYMQWSSKPAAYPFD